MMASPLVHAIPQLSGVPKKYQRKVKELREARSKQLPPREADLADNALKSYFSEGMPIDAAGLRRAMEATDATAFLPEVRAMITVTDSEINSSDRRSIQAIIDRANGKGRLTYADLVDALDHFLGDRRLELNGFPLVLEFPVGRGFNKQELATYFVLGVGPIEITQKNKVADATLYNPRRYGVHDQLHVRLSLNASSFGEEHIKTFEDFLDVALMRMEAEQILLRMPLARESFNVFHEAADLFEKGLLQRYRAASGPLARRILLENKMAGALYRQNPVRDSTQQVLVSLRGRAVRYLKASADPELQRSSAEYLLSERNGQLKVTPLESDLEAVLLRHARNPDLATRLACLESLLSRRADLSRASARALLDALKDPQMIARVAAIATRDILLPQLTLSDLRELLIGLLSNTKNLQHWRDWNAFSSLSKDPRISEVLGSLDEGSMRLLNSLAHDPGEGKYLSALVSKIPPQNAGGAIRILREGGCVAPALEKLFVGP